MINIINKNKLVHNTLKKWIKGNQGPFETILQRMCALLYKKC